MPGGRFHWPPKFGYLVSSQACALIGVHRPMATVSAPIMFAARESTPDGLRSIITSSLADEWLAISLALHSVLRAAIDCGTPRRYRRQAFSYVAPPSGAQTQAYRHPVRSPSLLGEPCFGGCRSSHNYLINNPIFNRP